jgi:hypothetical protein
VSHLGTFVRLFFNNVIFFDLLLENAPPVTSLSAGRTRYERISGSLRAEFQ